MLALSLESAKTIAIAVIAVFVIGGIAAAWLMKTIIQKVAVALILGILAFAVYSQRTSLQDCSDRVKESYERVGVDVTFLDTSCNFFGVDITISDPRGDDA